MPSRPILDFLVQYFIAEVDWFVALALNAHFIVSIPSFVFFLVFAVSYICAGYQSSSHLTSHRIDSLVNAQWFLTTYRQWWSLERISYIADVDFVVLVLRMCSYASQFLPSPSYTLESIRGVSLTDIRASCDAVADELAAIGDLLDHRGSLIRIQHVSLLGLRLQCEGHMRMSWEMLSRAVRLAQGLGIDRNNASVSSGAQVPGLTPEMEREMQQTTFCCLYVWDSILSRQLDRVPLLPNGPATDNWPRTHHLAISNPAEEGQTQPEGRASDPGPFTERILQARLADFWRNCNASTMRKQEDIEYDVMAAQDRYERFCTEFLTSLPPSFAVLQEPDCSWDRRLPKLALQRQQLHIIMFVSVCANFRPLLMMQNAQLYRLPAYKRVLLVWQRQALAAAALCVLDRVKAMHTILGRSHSRFVGLVFPTFEAAILLGCLLLSADTHYGADELLVKISPPGAPGACGGPIQAAMVELSRETCLGAAQGALGLLRMLSEVSSMAAAGADALSRLLDKVVAGRETEGIIKTSASAPSGAPEIPADWHRIEQLDAGLLAELDVSALASQEFHWGSLMPDMGGGVGD